MTGAEWITAFFTLFLIIDPIALVPVFIALTLGQTEAQRRAIGIRALLIALVLLTLFGLVGDKILTFIGITMPAFRIAGGILLFLTALDMLFDRRTQRREGQAQTVIETHNDPSVFPLATPLIAGPGALATMILLASQHQGDPVGLLALEGALVAALSVSLVSFLLAGAVERLLGRIGILVVTRLMGMLLAALAVQFVLDGIRGTGIIPS